MFKLSENILRQSPLNFLEENRGRLQLRPFSSINQEFLIFDEPTAGLDLSGIFSIKEILENFRKDKKGFLVATHEPGIFYDLCDRVVTLEKGRLIEDRLLR